MTDAQIVRRIKKICREDANIFERRADEMKSSKWRGAAGEYRGSAATLREILREIRKMEINRFKRRLAGKVVVK